MFRTYQACLDGPVDEAVVCGGLAIASLCGSEWAQKQLDSLYQNIKEGFETTVDCFGKAAKKVNSQTLWKDGKLRLDVENPNPAERPGPIHIQVNGTQLKWHFDLVNIVFVRNGQLAPNAIQDLLTDKISCMN